MLRGRSLQTTYDDVYPTGCAVHRVCPRGPCPVGRRVGFACAPGAAGHRFSGRALTAIGLAGSTFCEVFLVERLGWLRCVPRSSVTESGRSGPFPKSGPRPLSSPSAVGPKLSLRQRWAGLARSLGPTHLASRDGCFRTRHVTPFRFCHLPLPHEHDLNAFELRSAHRRPLVGDTEEPRWSDPKTEPPCERLRGEPRRRPV